MIQGIDQLVLTVDDIQLSTRFFKSLPGMEIASFGEGRQAGRFGQQRIRLQRPGSEFEPRAPHPMPGSANLCLISNTPFTALQAHLEEQGLVIIEGPLCPTGAGGPIMSRYFPDPDPTLTEVAAVLDLN